VIVLWILATVSAVNAASYGLRYVHQPVSLARTICKACAVGALTVISALCGTPALLTIALALGTVGDVVLIKSEGRGFLPALVAFLMGHIAYVILFLGLGSNAALHSVAMSGTLALAVAVILHKLWPHLGAMRAPVALYALVILAMGFALSMLPLKGALILVVLGGFAFITSDAILGFELFVNHTKTGHPTWPATALWFLYWGGQTLILTGVVMSWT
jgi:uncharacterized membrane protein YhhN